jgi:enoyl-CoA hydratase/carnithine racemase
MASDTILVERMGGNPGVTLLTLNRPEVMNAINTELGEWLDEILANIAEQPSVRVVVVTGAGDRAFSAGGDLKERMTMTPEQWMHQHRIFERAFFRIRNLRKPIIAAVNGIAAGGGCELAMNCDFIIASENARFGQPEVKRGIMPGGGGTQNLPRFVPRGLALELLMTGELIDAQTAARVGLVNHVYPRESLLADAERIASLIASNSPAAVQQAKRSAKLGISEAIEQAIEIELECYLRMVDHPDRYEGVMAFNERREPQFQDVR